MHGKYDSSGTVKGKGKRKAVSVHVVKAHSRSKVLVILNLGTRRRWVVNISFSRGHPVVFRIILKWNKIYTSVKLRKHQAPSALHPHPHPPGKKHWWPLNRSLLGPQNQSGRLKEEIISCTFRDLKSESFRPYRTRYNDYDIPTPTLRVVRKKSLYVHISSTGATTHCVFVLQRTIASSRTRFLDHTRRATVGRNPLEDWSARRRDLYPKIHNTHNKQTSMPPVGLEPTISAGERP